MIAKKFKLPINEFPKNHQVIYRGDFFSLRSVPNNLSYNRLGVVFKSGAFKTAVLRNRLRRIVFDYFRTETDFFKEIGPDFVLQNRGSSIPNQTEGLNGIGRTDLLITLNPPIINLTREEIISRINNDIDPIQRITAPPAR